MHVIKYMAYKGFLGFKFYSYLQLQQPAANGLSAQAVFLVLRS